MALRQISKQLTQRLGLGVSPAWQLSFARAYAEGEVATPIRPLIRGLSDSV